MAELLPSELSFPISDLGGNIVHTFEEAKTAIKTRFATFHQLLWKREDELLSELDRIESINRTKLEPLQEDMRTLELTLQMSEVNIKSNNLAEFLKSQKKLLNTKIFEIGTKKYFLDKVCLNWDINESIFEKIAELYIFRTKKEERDTIAPLLELKPIEGDTWYVVCDTWFHKWRGSVNLDNSDLTKDDGVMENIPIDNLGILGKDLDSVSITTLHSNAWNQLLCWHGLAEGSVPISITTHSNLEPTSGTKLRFCYKILRNHILETVNYIYLYPTQTFQEVYDVVMEGISIDKQLIKMFWKLKQNRNMFRFSHTGVYKPLDDATLVTDFSRLIGTNTNLRLYICISEKKSFSHSSSDC